MTHQGKLHLFYFFYFLFVILLLFDRDNAVKQSHKLAADLIHIDFIASANSRLQSLLGLFHNIAVQSKYTSSKNNHVIIPYSLV